MKTEVKALFKDFNAGEKKDVLKFELKGDMTDAQIVALHKLKGGQVFVQISSSQMDLDDLDEDEREGIEFSVGEDGIVNVTPDQLSIDDVQKQKDHGEEESSGEDTSSEAGEIEPNQDDKDAASEETEEQPASPENVADIAQERKRRGRPKKSETDPVDETPPVSDDQPENPIGHTADDDLPF